MALDDDCDDDVVVVVVVDLKQKLARTKDRKMEGKKKIATDWGKSSRIQQVLGATNELLNGYSSDKEKNEMALFGTMDSKMFFPLEEEWVNNFQEVCHKI